MAVNGGAVEQLPQVPGHNKRQPDRAAEGCGEAALGPEDGTKSPWFCLA